MATLREYFDTSFPRMMGLTSPIVVQAETLAPVEVPARLHLDFDSNCKFFSLYAPKHASRNTLFGALLKNIPAIMDSMKGLEVSSGYPWETPTTTSELRFTGRVYLYSESDIPRAEIEIIEGQARTVGLSVRVRERIFAEEKSKLEKPVAFISHDSRNKDAIARPIAIGLVAIAD